MLYNSEQRTIYLLTVTLVSGTEYQIKTCIHVYIIMENVSTEF